MSHDGKRITFVTNEDGIGERHLLDTATGRELPAPKLPVGSIGGAFWHNNLAFSLSTARSPGDAYSLDMNSGKVERWARTETVVNTESFPAAELVRWKSFDGKTISGFLHRPPSRFTSHWFPDIRGSTGFGKPFTKLDDGFLGEDSYKDINALFDWIATRPDLDPDRIAVTGASYGGHMTLAISMFYSARIRCSIDVVGISNLVTFLEHTEAYRRDLRRVE